MLTTACTLNPDNLFSLRDCNNFKKRTFGPCLCKQMRNGMYNLKKKKKHTYVFVKCHTEKQNDDSVFNASTMGSPVFLYLLFDYGATEGCLPVQLFLFFVPIEKAL